MEPHYKEGARFKLRRPVRHEGLVYPAGALVIQSQVIPPSDGRLSVRCTDDRLVFYKADFWVPVDDLEYIGPPYQYQPGEAYYMIGQPDRQYILDNILIEVTYNGYEGFFLQDINGGFLSISAALPAQPRYPLDQPGPPPPPPRGRQYVTDVSRECSGRNRYDDDLGCYEDPVFYECLSNDPDQVIVLPSGYCINRSTARTLQPPRDPMTRAPLDAAWRRRWGV
jgi:hypothetical protein